MRILHCLRAPVGGLFRHVLDLAAEQSRRGHEVGILADSTAENRLTVAKFAEIAPALKLGVLRTPMSRQPGIGDYRAYRTVLAHAAGLNLDVLHGHGAKGGAYARLARRALRARGQRVKAFYTPHGGSLNLRPGTPATTLLLTMERLLERNCDGLIFESAYASRIYAERVGEPMAPFRVIPNGLQAFDFTSPELTDDASDFLFVGELRTLKGVPHLLEALSRPALAKATATIVGAGPEADEFKSLAATLDLGPRVRFTGALAARDAFTMGRIMVVPSLAESFPYIVLEAAAAGLPLIATDVGGIPEIVEGTDTRLIKAGQSEFLAGAMSAALSDPKGAAARAKRLRDKVARRYTVAGMADAVLNFYTVYEFLTHRGTEPALLSSR